MLLSDRSTCVRVKSSKQFSRKSSFRQHRHSIQVLRTHNREVRQIQWIGYSRMDLEHNAGWSKINKSNKKSKQFIDWPFIIKQSSKFYYFCWTLVSFPKVSTDAVDPELKFRAPAVGFKNFRFRLRPLNVHGSGFGTILSIKNWKTLNGFYKCLAQETMSAEQGRKFQTPAPVPPFKNFGFGSSHSTLLVLRVAVPQTCLKLSWSICIKITFLKKYEEMDSWSLEANVHTPRKIVKYCSTLIVDFFNFAVIAHPHSTNVANICRACQMRNGYDKPDRVSF